MSNLNDWLKNNTEALNSARNEAESNVAAPGEFKLPKAGTHIFMISSCKMQDNQGKMQGAWVLVIDDPEDEENGMKLRLWDNLDSPEGMNVFFGRLKRAGISIAAIENMVELPAHLETLTGVRVSSKLDYKEGENGKKFPRVYFNKVITDGEAAPAGIQKGDTIEVELPELGKVTATVRSIDEDDIVVVYEGQKYTVPR